MPLTKDELISAIKEMNVVDLADLVKSLEEEFGVTAAAPVAVAAAPAADAAAPAEEEKTEFEVRIVEIGPEQDQCHQGRTGSDLSRTARSQGTC